MRSPWVATYLGDDDTDPGAADGPEKSGYKWKVSDRTHRVALEGTIKVEYKRGNVVAPHATAKVPAKTTVKLNVNILRSPGGQGGVATDASVQEDVTKMREIYAQAGIRVEAKLNPPVDPPGGVRLGDGLRYSTTLLGGKVLLSDEEDALLGAATLRTPADAFDLDDIEVYYINRFSGVPMYGNSYPAANVTDAKYADSVVIAAEIRLYNTLAHEVMHVLENRPLVDDQNRRQNPHYPYTPYAERPEDRDPMDTVNLMVEGQRTVTAGQEKDSRRLTPGQEADAESKRPNLLHRP